MTRQSRGRGGEQVSDAELAEIARQLRGALGQTPPPPATVRPPLAPSPAPAEPGTRAGSKLVMARFVGAFVAPGLVLVAIVLLSDLVR